MRVMTRLLVVVSLFSAWQLYALGIRIADQDSLATARGNAFTATADNPSAIYYNPAGITQLEGQNASYSLYGIYLKSSFRSTSGNEFDTKDELQAVPHLYYTFTPKVCPVSAGIGVYTPYGLGLEWPFDSQFRVLATEGRILYMTVNPVVAWKILPSLSIAAGPTLNYSQAQLKRGIGVLANDEFKFKGDGWAAGYTAGILWRPHPKHAFGVSYRSATRVDFEGHSSTTPSPPLPARQSASAEFDFPQNVIVGYSFRPTPDWNFEVNIDWTDWDSLNTVTLKQPSGNQPLPFNWRSSFFYEFGATRFFDGGWRVSAGYIFSENSVPESSFNPAVPDSDRHIFSLGAGRNYEHWRWDLAYQLAYGPSRDVTGTPFGLADGRYEFISHAINLSIGYAF